MQGRTSFDSARDEVFMNSRFIAMIFLSSFVCILTGCKEIRSAFGQVYEDFGMMSELEDHLERKYYHDEFNFYFSDGKFLTVTFINSPFNDLDDKDREKQAREIALFTLSMLNKLDYKAEKINIAFSINKKIIFIFDYTNTLKTFYFDVAELKKALDEKQPDKSLQPEGVHPHSRAQKFAVSISRC